MSDGILIGKPGLNPKQKAHLMNMLAVREPPPGGVRTVTMSFEEWAKLHAEWQQAQTEGVRHDSGYEPFTKYGVNLCCMADGTPRPNGPLRPLLEREAGMLGDGRIIILEDRMPGDRGGMEIQVTEQLEGGDE